MGNYESHWFPFINQKNDSSQNLSAGNTSCISQCGFNIIFASRSLKIDTDCSNNIKITQNQSLPFISACLDFLGLEWVRSQEKTCQHSIYKPSVPRYVGVISMYMFDCCMIHKYIIVLVYSVYTLMIQW